MDILNWRPDTFLPSGLHLKNNRFRLTQKTEANRSNCGQTNNTMAHWLPRWRRRGHTLPHAVLKARALGADGVTERECWMASAVASRVRMAACGPPVYLILPGVACAPTLRRRRWSCDGVATAWGGLSPGACGESRGRRKQVRHGGSARRGARASSWTTHWACQCRR
jgi:hypothetical protein